MAEPFIKLLRDGPEGYSGPEYSRKLMDDVPEQFKNQYNIRVLLNVLAQQLNELATFYRDLITARTIAGASGKNLDRIGDIVCLTRAEATAVSALTGEEMDDAMYRRYLLYKITLNSSACTLQDIYDAVRAFSNDVAFYSEDIEHQATIILEMSEALYHMFQNFKFSKPAGVQILYNVFSTDNGDGFGLKSYFSYYPIDKITIDWTMVIDEELGLEQNNYSVKDGILTVPSTSEYEGGVLTLNTTWDGTDYGEIGGPNNV